MTTRMTTRHCNQRFHFHSTNDACRLQGNAWWLLPAALLSGGYGCYKHRHHLWTTTSDVNLSVVANQPSNQDQFRVPLLGITGSKYRDTTHYEEWMAQIKNFLLTSTVVHGLSLAGKCLCKYCIMCHIITIIVLILVAVRSAAKVTYRYCPSNKVLVVYGRGFGMPMGQISKTLHGGGTFILPVLQDYRYLSLEPMQVQYLSY